MKHTHKYCTIFLTIHALSFRKLPVPVIVAVVISVGSTIEAHRDVV